MHFLDIIYRFVLMVGTLNIMRCIFMGFILTITYHLYFELLWLLLSSFVIFL